MIEPPLQQQAERIRSGVLWRIAAGVVAISAALVAIAWWLVVPPPAAERAATPSPLEHALFAVIAAVFLIRYRRRSARIPLTPRVTAPLWLESVVFGGLLAMFCAWWAIGFAQYRRLETPPPDAMPIYVTAKQWMWEFAYPSGPTSADVLAVPVGWPVKLIMTSRDAIHSFYVPAFRTRAWAGPACRSSCGRSTRPA